MSIRTRARALVLLALAAAVPAVHAAYAGLWFQCQPRWTAEQNYLLVDVHRGERAWNARWGAADTAQGQAAKDADGNLVLRGCHALAGQPTAHCDPAKAPTFAQLPKAVAAGQGLPADAALARGGWLRTERAGVEQLARQCAALRPKASR